MVTLKMESRQLERLEGNLGVGAVGLGLDWLCFWEKYWDDPRLAEVLWNSVERRNSVPMKV